MRAGRLVGRRLPPVPLPSWAVWPAAVVTRAVSAIVPQPRPTADRLRAATGATDLGSDVKVRAELGFAPPFPRRGSSCRCRVAAA